MALTH